MFILVGNWFFLFCREIRWWTLSPKLSCVVLFFRSLVLSFLETTCHLPYSRTGCTDCTGSNYPTHRSRMRCHYRAGTGSGTAHQPRTLEFEAYDIEATQRTSFRHTLRTESIPAFRALCHYTTGRRSVSLCASSCSYWCVYWCASLLASLWDSRYAFSYAFAPHYLLVPLCAIDSDWYAQWHGKQTSALDFAQSMVYVHKNSRHTMHSKVTARLHITSWSSADYPYHFKTARCAAAEPPVTPNWVALDLATWYAADNQRGSRNRVAWFLCWKFSAIFLLNFECFTTRVTFDTFAASSVCQQASNLFVMRMAEAFLGRNSQSRWLLTKTLKFRWNMRNCWNFGWTLLELEKLKKLKKMQT